MDERVSFEGICFGGPLHGQTWISRFPKGFLLIDRPADKVWFYEWNQTGLRFDVRSEEPEKISTEGLMNRFRAAEESNYDVIAAPWASDTNVN